MVASAPGLTIGLVRPASPRSTAAAELNGRPVASTPMARCARSTPSASQTSAKTNGFATLITVNPTSASPTAWVWPVTFTTASPNSAGSTRLSAG